MRYVVLGASAAGINGVRELRRLDPESEIILVSRDREIYSRCILHHYLGGIRDKEGICFAEPDFEARYRVKWYKGMSCTGLDAEAREIIISGGIRIGYDRLLIATGSRTSLPPVEGLGTNSGHGRRAYGRGRGHGIPPHGEKSGAGGAGGASAGKAAG